MHGRIFWELRDYIERCCGRGTWLKVLTKAGIEEKIYLQQIYPDAEMVALIKVGCEIAGKDFGDFLEGFGEHTAPSLLKAYGNMIKPAWRTLEVIENTERTGHRAMRMAENGAAPPFLQVKRLGPDKLSLTYSSPRKLCGFAVGVVKGLGKHFGEEVSIRHVSCMLRGAESCEMEIEAHAAHAMHAKAQSAGR